MREVGDDDAEDGDDAPTALTNPEIAEVVWSLRPARLRRRPLVRVDARYKIDSYKIPKFREEIRRWLEAGLKRMAFISEGNSP
jgi:hypothetical protein